jgi:SAM-dependent methyltransferase
MFAVVFLVIAVAIGIQCAFYLFSESVPPLASLQFIQGQLLRDPFYAQIFDQLYPDSGEYTQLQSFFMNKDPDQTHHLDIGCGTGRLVKLLADQGAHSTGIDMSDAFVAVAKQATDAVATTVTNAVKPSFILGNALTYHWFSASAFTHITCTHHTCYYFDASDKRRLLSNCFYWLKPGGKMVMRLFPDVSSVANLLQTTQPTSIVHPNYGSIHYTASVVPVANMDNGPVTFIQNFSDNSTFLRSHEQILFIDSVSRIIELAESVGFHVPVPTHSNMSPFITLLKP